MDLSFLGKAISFAVPALAPVVAAVGAGINAVAGAVNQQPGASAENASSSSGTATQSQGIANLPKEIQNVINAVGKTLKNASTSELQAELAARTGVTKSQLSSTPTAQAGNTETDSVADASSTETEAATGTSTAAVSNPTNARTSMQNGQAVFENDNYIIAAGDNNKVTIYNKKTKEVYEAVGDPSMKIDGKAGFSGKGTMSLMLNDGTKVTMGREDDGKGGTLASKLTITNGAYGAQIKGIDTTKTGDLAVQEFSGQGQELDEKVADGVTMEENQDININNGRGFVVKDANGAATLVSKEYLAKVGNANMKSGNLDQFDLPGGEKQAGTPTQAASTGSGQTNDPVQPTQTTVPANTAGSKAIQDQFAKNQVLRQPSSCFGTGQQTSPTTPQKRAVGKTGQNQNQNQNRNTDVRTAQTVNTNRRSTQLGNAMQPVRNDTVRRQPAGRTYEAFRQAQTSQRPDVTQRSAPASRRPVATPSQARESVVRTTLAETSKKATTTLVNFQKPVFLDVPQMPQDKIFGLSAFAGKVPNSEPIKPIRV